MAKTDASVNDIRKRIREVAKTTVKYPLNFGKLLLVGSGSQYMNTKMPILNGMYEANQELVHDTMKFLRNPAESIKKQIDVAMGGETVKALDKLWQYAIEDLKSGNFYDENRDRSEYGQGVDDLLSDFGGIDMDGFDENGDWSEQAEDPAAKTNIKIAEVQESNADQRARATVGAIGTATEAMIAESRVARRENMRMGIKQHSQMMSGFSNLITTNAAMFEQTNEHMRLMMEMTREANTQIITELKTTNELLSSIRDHVAPKEREKSSSSSGIDFYKGGAIDIKAYLKTVTKKTMDNTGIGSMLSMATMGQSPAELIKLFHNDPWMLVTDHILSKIIPASLAKTMETFNKNLENFIPAALTKMFDFGKKAETGEGGIGAFLASVFGINPRSYSSIETGTRNTHDKAVFTNKVARAITDVMPAQLSKIIHLLGGKQQAFNYESGKFENMTDVISRSQHDVNDLAGRMSSASGVYDRARGIQFKTDKDRGDFDDYIYKYLQSMSEGGKFINPFVNKKTFMDNMPDSAGANKDAYYSYLASILRSMPREDLMALAGDVSGSRASRHRANENINNNLHNNGLITAFSGIVDEDDYNLISDKTQGRKALSSKDIDILLKNKAKERSRQGSAMGPGMALNDVANMLRRGIITYTYIMGNASGKNNKGVLPPNMRDAMDDADLFRSNMDYRLNEEMNDKKYADERAKRDREEYDKKSKLTIAGNKLMADGSAFDPDAGAAILKELSYVTGDTSKYENDPDYKKNKAIYDNYLAPTANKINAAKGSAAEKSGINKFAGWMQKVMNKPFEFIEAGMKTVDAAMFKILFGEDVDITNPDGSKDPYLINSISTAVKVHFENAKDWFKNHIGGPLKDYLMGEKGIFTKIGNFFQEKLYKPAKEKIQNTVLGKKNDQGYYSGGLLSDHLNDANWWIAGKKKQFVDSGKNALGYAGDQIKGAVKNILYGKSEGDTPDFDGDGNWVGNKEDRNGGIVGSIKSSFGKFKEFMFGPADKQTNSKKLWAETSAEVKQALPDMGKGALAGGALTLGAGLLTGLWLPGGPLMGAMLGSFGGFIKSSEKFKTFLFGEEDFDKDGNPTGKRKGALISQHVQEGFKKFAPKMMIGAGVGAALGNMGLLPFGVGHIVGGIAGAMGGMISASDNLKRILFGNMVDGVDDEGNPIKYRDGGLFDKNFRDAVKKALPGAAIGGIATGMGLIPGLALLPGGPILGALAGAGIALNSGNIANFLFGGDVDETDEHGKPTGEKKHRDGVFEPIFNFARDKIVTPFGKTLDKWGHNINTWFMDSIVAPLDNALQPMKDAMAAAGQSMKDSMANIGNSIKESLDKTFDKFVGMPFGKFFEEKVITPMKSMVNKIFSGIGKFIGSIVSAPFKVLETMFTGRDRMKEERQARRADRKKNEKARRFNILNDFFGEGNGLVRWLRGTDDFQDKKTHNKADGENKPSFFERMKEKFSKGKDTLGGIYKDGHDETIANREAKRAKREQESNDIKERAKKLKEDAEKNKRTTGASDVVNREHAKNSSDSANRERSKQSTEDSSGSHVGGNSDTNTSVKNANKQFRWARDNHQHLKDIADNTRKTNAEIKGEFGGVGWNLEYIKTILAKHFGKLGKDELPENMEGGKKVKKRRGLLGRVMDKVAGVGGGLLRGGKAMIGAGLSFILTPLQFLADNIFNAASVIGNVVGGLWNLVKGAGKAIVGGVKLIGSTIKNAAEIAGEFLKGIAGHLGNILGDAGELLSGAIKEGALGIMALGRGALEIIGAVAPEVVKGLMHGVKFLAKGILHGAMGVGGFIGDKLFGMAKTKVKNIGTFRIEGGHLDSILNSVPVAVGEGIHQRPFPYVTLLRGKPLEKPKIAIPVYIAGGSGGDGSNSRKRWSGKRPSGGSSGGGSDAPSMNVSDYTSEYLSVDREAERGHDPAQAYDDAIAKAKTPEELQAIRDAQMFNGSSGKSKALVPTTAKKTDTADSGMGLMAKVLQILGLIPNIAWAVGGLAKKILGVGFKSGLLSRVAGISQLMDGNPDNDSYGVKNIVLPGLRNVGINTSSGVKTLAKSSLGDVINNAKTVKAAGGSIKVMAEDGSKGLAGKICKVLQSGIDKITGNKVVQALAGGMKNKLASMGKAVVSAIAKYLPDALKKGANKVATSGLKQILGVSTLGLATAGFAIYDFISGMNNASEYFTVSSADATIGMKLASAFAKTAIGLLGNIPYAGFLLTFIPIAPVAQLLYSAFASDDAKTALANNQTKMQDVVNTYNQQNGTSMSVQDYVNQKKGATSTDNNTSNNTPWYKKLANWFVDKASQQPAQTSTGVNMASAYGSLGAGPGLWGTGKGPTGMEYFNQKDSKWNSADPSQNLAAAGCGPTVAAMVATRYGAGANPIEASQLSKAYGMRAADGGTNPAFFSQYSAGKGFSMNQTAPNAGTAESRLAQNKPVVFMGQGGSYGKNMHYMVADKLNGRGRANVVDPLTGHAKSISTKNLTKNASAMVVSDGGLGTGAGNILKRAFSKFGRGTVDSNSQIEAMIKIAEGEVGYKEKASESQLDDKNANAGSANFTKYGAWYGSNGVAWCQIFQSWCANQAGIPTTVIPKTSSTSASLNFFKKAGLTHSPDGYAPKRGDLVFYAYGGSVNHVGLVTGSDGTNFTTIEGNSGSRSLNNGGGVVTHTHPINGSSVLAFASPAYNGQSVAVDASAATTAGATAGAAATGIAGLLANATSITDKVFSPLNTLASNAGNILNNIFGNAAPATTSTPTTTTTPTASSGDNSQLGSYVKKFESGNSGSTNISHTAGDHGGASFGTYQFASFGKEKADAGENLTKFWNKYYAAKHPGIYPGSNSAFEQAWRQEAKADPTGFANNEHLYVKSNYYDPARATSIKNGNVDPDKLSRAAQEAIWSGAVQYGPITFGRLVGKAMAGKSPQSMQPTDFIDTLYDYKKNSVGSYFPHSSPAIRRSLATHRIPEEKSLLEGIASQPPLTFGAGPGLSLDGKGNLNWGRGATTVANTSGKIVNYNKKIAAVRKTIDDSDVTARVTNALTTTARAVTNTASSSDQSALTSLVSNLSNVMSEVLNELRAIRQNAEQINTNTANSSHKSSGVAAPTVTPTSKNTTTKMTDAGAYTINLLSTD